MMLQLRALLAADGASAAFPASSVAVQRPASLPAAEESALEALEQFRPPISSRSMPSVPAPTCSSLSKGRWMRLRQADGRMARISRRSPKTRTVRATPR